MSDELKPCPFCGEPGSLNYRNRVFCPNIECPNHEEFGVDFFLGAWQNRPIEDALTAQLQQVTADNESLHAELATQLTKAIDLRRERDEAQQWISVKAQQPDEGQQAIIYDGDEVSIATWQDGWWWLTPEFTADDVTCWMPLPPAPSGGEKDADSNE
jgi:hypothetical protein